MSRARAYYNERDKYAAQWLRNLIKAGLIAPGDVDERSIEDVRPVDLRGYTQCHFFAGIGVWSRALRRAGWRDDRQVWTGSCPCQPFSTAGKGAGFADERHLWPAFFHLIEICRPAVVFGEQVASKDGLEWIDLVRADLEAEKYAFGAADLCAAGVGAPHIRQRLFWVADVQRKGLEGLGGGHQAEGRQRAGSVRSASAGGELGGLADGTSKRERADESGRNRNNRVVVVGAEQRGHSQHDGSDVQRKQESSPIDGFWRDADWLACRDGKWRPVEPGTFPLAHGVAGRVGRLRAYGNAIVSEVATQFILAWRDVRDPVDDDL